MSDSLRERLVVEPQAAAEPEIGRWLWLLDDARSATLRVLNGIDPAALDWVDACATNTISALLYHIALVEADWLYNEVLEQPLPTEVANLLPYDARDEQTLLTAVRGEPLETHLQRLDAVRAYLLAAFCPMSHDDFRRPRALPEYDVTPEWVLHHLLQHEAEHRSEIAALRARAEQALGIVSTPK